MGVGSGRGNETALIYLSNHKLAGSHNATRRESATIFLSLVRGGIRGPRAEGVNVTRVCVACSTGNAIYTMQIKRARAARIRDPIPRPARFVILLLTFLLLYRIARRPLQREDRERSTMCPCKYRGSTDFDFHRRELLLSRISRFGI